MTKEIFGPLERHPVHSSEKAGFGNDASETSQSVNRWRTLVSNASWLASTYGYGPEGSFRAPALHPHRANEADSYRGDTDYSDQRDHRTLAGMYAFKTDETLDEFAGKDVLEVACGVGRAGSGLEEVGAKLTYVDISSVALSAIRSKGGGKVLASGVNLPFRNDSFDKTIDMFGTPIWVLDPLECAQALLEQIRVTRVGGSTFSAPLFGSVMNRQQEWVDCGGRLTREDRTRLALIGARDYALTLTLYELLDEKVIDATFKLIQEEGLDRKQRDAWSTIIDIKKPLDPEFREGIETKIRQDLYGIS